MGKEQLEAGYPVEGNIKVGRKQNVKAVHRIETKSEWK